MNKYHINAEDMVTLTIDAVEEGVIVHTYGWEDRQNFWFCMKVGGKYYLAGLSTDVQGKLTGGVEDLEKFKEIIAPMQPRVYTAETHRLWLQARDHTIIAAKEDENTVRETRESLPLRLTDIL